MTDSYDIRHILTDHPIPQALAAQAAQNAAEVKDLFAIPQGSDLAAVVDFGIPAYIAVFYQLREAVHGYMAVRQALATALPHYRDYHKPDQYPLYEAIPAHERDAAVGVFLPLFAAQLLRARLTDYLEPTLGGLIAADEREPLLREVLHSTRPYLIKYRQDLARWGHISVDERGALTDADWRKFHDDAVLKLYGNVVKHARHLFIAHEVTGRERYDEDRHPQPVQPLGVAVYPSHLPLTEALMRRCEQAERHLGGRAR